MSINNKKKSYFNLVNFQTAKNNQIIVCCSDQLNIADGDINNIDRTRQHFDEKKEFVVIISSSVVAGAKLKISCDCVKHKFEQRRICPKKKR